MDWYPQALFPAEQACHRSFCVSVCVKNDMPLKKVRSDKHLENTFKRTKEELADKVQQLLKEGKSLNEQKKKIEIEKWSCNKWGTQRKLNNEQHKFETNCMIAEREFQRLDMIAAYKEKVEPCKYTCYLVLGALMAILSIVFMVHIFLYAVLKVENKNVQPFLNGMIEDIEGSRAGFLATVLIVLMCYYFVFAAARGNVKFGLRFFFISFYPIVPKETFVNSFFANCLVMNVWMFAMMQFCTKLFRGYLRGTDAAKIYLVHVRHMEGMAWVWEKNFFIVWAAVWWFIAFIYFCLKPQEKIVTQEGINKSDLSDKAANQN